MALSIVRPPRLSPADRESPPCLLPDRRCPRRCRLGSPPPPRSGHRPQRQRTRLRPRRPRLRRFQLLSPPPPHFPRSLQRPAHSGCDPHSAICPRRNDALVPRPRRSRARSQLGKSPFQSSAIQRPCVLLVDVSTSPGHGAVLPWIPGASQRVAGTLRPVHDRKEESWEPSVRDRPGTFARHWILVRLLLTFFALRLSMHSRIIRKRNCSLSPVKSAAPADAWSFLSAANPKRLIR